MAVAKIKKLEIIGLDRDRRAILELLQELGAVQPIDIQQPGSTASQQMSSGEAALLDIEEAISFLAGFKEKAGFLAEVVTFKPVVYRRDLNEVINAFDWQGLLKEVSDLRHHLKTLSGHQERLHQERQFLLAWHDLKIPLNEPHSTQNCALLFGVLRAKDYPHMLGDCEREGISLFCEAVKEDRTNAYLALIYLKKDFERLEALLKEHHFNFVTFARHAGAGTVKERLFEINREAVVLQDQILDAKDKIARLSKESFKLMLVYDYFSNIKRARGADGNLAKRQFTFILSGWIRRKDVRATEKALSGGFEDLMIFISEPQGEEVPVDLENKKILQPFEFITRIYGMPKYNEVDPTPFLAPFFLLYFGLCVSDVGYGLSLIAISWLALKKLRLGMLGIRFFRLFLLGGISTVIMGALTGSWFGNLFDLLGGSHRAFLPLKAFKDSLVVLDPLKESTKFLGIALMLGIIQVWFGNVVAAIGNIKNKRYIDVILDQIPMLAFLFGLTGLGLVFLKLLEARHANLFTYTVAAAAGALILTQGRSEKGFGLKIFYGAYNLYNSFSGYLSDILSYSRLWALGLVTGVMATTVNLIAVQFSQILPSLIPFVGTVPCLKAALSAAVLIAIFVFGHCASFMMNLLGAFVHPLRLQFVEFFSKFFKGGGNTFRPFKVETKYVNISQ